MAKPTSGYGLDSPLETIFPSPIKSVRTPSVNDTNYPIGQIWVNTAINQLYALVSIASSQASWAPLGPGISDMDTLTGDTGGAISPTLGNTNILGGDLLSVDGAGSTLTLNATSGGYPVTPFVVGPVGQAGYQTIQSAINAANSAGGGSVYIQPDTYTEDLTLFDNIYLQGEDDVNCIITGVHTPPASGAVTFENLTLSSATDIFSSAAAGTTTLSLINCFNIVTNGFIFDLANWTGDLGLYQCGTGGTDDGVVNNTGGATLLFYQTVAGAGTGQTMVTSGTCDWDQLDINCPIDHQTGSVLDIIGCQLKASQTLSNDTTGTIVSSNYNTGATASLTMSSSGNVSLTNCSITSSNDPSIAGAGAGTLTLTSIGFTNNANIAATLTVAGGITSSGTFNTVNQASGLTLTDNIISTDGTDANIDLSLTPKGTGNVDITLGSLDVSLAGEGINIAEGANARMGTAVLVNGASVVATTAVTATSRIMLTSQVDGGNPGFLRVSTRVPATNFTITSSTPSDTSTVSWIIFEPA